MRMTTEKARVTAGVDAHADTHEGAVLDERGHLLGTRTFPTGSEGYRALLAWLEQFGELVVVGVESTGSYAAGLVRYLRARAVEVVEVNRPHAHARRRRGKSDPIDAEMAARQALAGEATAVPKLTTGIVESIRQLRVARDSAVKARSAALCQLTDLIVTAPDELRDQLSQRKTTRGKATLCSRLRPRASRLAEAAKFALRSLARRIARTRRRESPPSTSSSPRSSRPPRRAPPSCSGSPPATPANCSSPPDRTSSASPTTTSPARPTTRSAPTLPT
ncbi:MAG: IS110 family transposase [Solirubrobacteraceae bacterium]